ncbi:MAG: methyl-accepting chemotaxis protein [Burkholderiales bacterium]
MSKLNNLRATLSTRMLVINVVVTLLATLSTVMAMRAGTTQAGDTMSIGNALAFAGAIGLVAAVAGVFAMRWLVVDRLLLERETSLARAHAENDRVNQSVIAVLEAVHQLSQRDLTAKAPVTEDIIGAISDSVNQLALETAQVLTHVNEAAGEVERASLEVKSQADQFSDTSSAERQSLKGMVDVLSRASESMQRVALLAYNSNRVAVQAGKTTETALATVSSAVSGMASIRATIADVERRIKRLGERSHEIGQIVNLINTVSERTHVLALNASMQAAIAGEAGRGFAVVAEEVQRLAESSREATDRIGKLIYNMQIETTDAIAAMAKTIDRVVHEAEAAEASGAQMVATRETTAKLVEMVARISSSAEEQMTIATQLRASIDEIGADNARSVTQLAAQNQATTTLIAQAQRLVRTVGVFKLPIIART